MFECRNEHCTTTESNTCEHGLFSQNKQSSVCSKSTFHQWWRMTLCVRRYLCHRVLFVNYSLFLLQSCWNKYFNITNDLKTFLWKMYQGQKNLFSNRSKALIAHPTLSASISPIFIVSPSRHGHISSNSSVSSNQHCRSCQSSQAEMSPVARFLVFFMNLFPFPAKFQNMKFSTLQVHLSFIWSWDSIYLRLSVPTFQYRNFVL